MQRAWTILFFIILFSGPALADLKSFEKALDNYQFESAKKALPTVAEGNWRSLCEAEYRLRTERPELALRALSSVEPRSLQGEQKAKFLLVKALLERFHSDIPDSQRTKNSLRLIRDGLRSSPSPRDQTQLLLFKIRAAPPESLALAEEAEGELAELESVSDAVDLEAQALLSERKGRFTRAIRLWGSLATLARSAGQSHLESHYQYREARALRKAGKAEEADRLDRQLLNQALQQKSPFLAELAWDLYRRVPNRKTRDSAARSLYDVLPASQEKIRLSHNVAQEQKDREAKFAVFQTALEMAKKLDDPVLEAYVLNYLSFTTGSQSKRERLREQALDLLEPFERTYLHGTWYGSVRSIGKKAQYVDSKELKLTKLEEELLSVAPDQRVKILDKYYSSAIWNTEPQVLIPVFDRLLSQAQAGPEMEQRTVLDTVIRHLYYHDSMTNSLKPIGSRGLIERALTRMLVDRFRSDPKNSAVMVDAYLRDLRNERDPVKLARTYRELIAWMIVLDRLPEAQDILTAAWQNLPAPQSNILLKPEIELALKLGRPLTSEQITKSKEKARSGGQSRLRIASEMGWLQLLNGRPEVAESLAREALEEQSTVGSDELLAAGAHRLLSQARAAQGQVEEALSDLDQYEAKLSDRERAQVLLTRAQVLFDAGRFKDAYIATLGADRFSSAEKQLLSYSLRLTAARKLQMDSEVESLRQEIAKFSRKEFQVDQYPDFHYHLQTQFPECLGQPGLSRTPAAHFSGLAEVLRRLESLRIREPENQTLRRLGASEIRNLMETAETDEVFVQPVLLEHSVVILTIVKGEVVLQETLCHRERVNEALVGISTKLSTPNIDVKHATKDQEYLSRVLVQPWRSLFPQKTKLRWLGERELKSLPLSALPGNDHKPLVKTMSTAYLDGPGYSSLKLSSRARALVVGGARDLPGAVRELDTVRATFPKGESWALGQQLEELKRLSKEHPLVHIATHGQKPNQKNLAATLAGDGNRLSAFQLAELSFSDESLAVLGACESFVDAGTGRDNTSLVSALRTAGAQVVVGSLWRLDDEVTADLFADFYRQIGQGQEPDIALAQAQRGMLSRQSHPYYWAGLQVVSGP